MKISFKRPDPLLVRDLETERFLLHPMGVWETLRVTASWRTDAELLTGIYNSPRPRSLLRWLQTGPIPDNVSRFAFSITPKGADAPIGVHAIKYRDYRAASATVGLHDRAWWGKNVVVEVRAALMNHFFRHGGIERFVGSTTDWNAASIFIYRRLGFAHVGTWHRHRHNPVTGELADMVLFEMLKENWEQGPFAASQNDR